MHKILFATGNKEKFNHAVLLCKEFGIELEQAALDIDEIQEEDSELIVRDKAQKAFALVGKPVIVSDDSWSILGLNGFPGAYMKSMDHWFSSEDFLRLTSTLSDRRIVLSRWLTYQDASQTMVFKQDITGNLTKEVRGTYGRPAQKIITFPIDNGLTIAEVYDQGSGTSPERTRALSTAWIDFSNWLNKQR